MIPSFDGEGDLPSGIHKATWAEFQARFCRFARSNRRLRLCKKIEQLIIAARASGIVERLIFGGSFITQQKMSRMTLMWRLSFMLPWM